MIKIILFVFILTISINAKKITPNEVYGQVRLITDEIHFLLKHYDIAHDHDGIVKKVKKSTEVEPRNVWQKSYEIMIKINMFRILNGLSIIEPVNLEPILSMNPALVYEQTQRILTEIRVLKYRIGLTNEPYKLKTYKNKTALDVFNAFSHISLSFDELNQSEIKTSYVFGETLRIYDDLSTILEHLKLTDKTMPTKKDEKINMKDILNINIKILDKIKQVQIGMGIKTVDFTEFKMDNPTKSNIFELIQMTIAELQTIKAYIGLLHYVTPASTIYEGKTLAEVYQLMNWNLRKISLIEEIK